MDANKDGRLTESEIPKGYRMLLRPELPEGHPGRYLPWPMRMMVKGMDSDKDGTVSESEWTSRMTTMAAMDRPVLAALPLRELGPDQKSRTVWSHRRGIPEIPSPLLYEGKIFLLRDGGIVQCLEASSGKVLYQKRIGVPGGYSASPVAADGHIYFASQSGTVVVADARATTCRVLARNKIGAPITATPAIVGDHLYVRTATDLIAFAE